MVSVQVVGYSTTDDALGHFQPQERNCYVDDEFQPLYFNKVLSIRSDLLLKLTFKSGGFRYEMSNCLYSSIIQKIQKECSCQPIFAGTSTSRMNNELPKLRRCVGSALKCMRVGIILKCKIQ